jgi:hypothetical protein
MTKWIQFTVTSVVFLVCVGDVYGDAVNFTPTEQSLGAMLEAGIMTVSMFQQAAGLPNSLQQISYSGSMTSSSWDLTLGGSYNGNPVNIELISMAPGSFSSTATSTFNSTSWSDSGTWMYTSTGVGQLDMTFASNVSFLSSIFDREVVKMWAKSHTDSVTNIVDTGQYFWTLFGVKIFPTGQAPQISDYIIPDGSPDRAIVTVSLPLESINLIGTADFVGDTTTGTIDFVPEPGTLLLLGVGLITVALARRFAWSSPSGFKTKQT